MIRLNFIIFTLIFMLAQSCSAQSKTVLVMGDSLSAGYGINVQESWVSLLQKEMAKNSSVSIVNASVSGETTAGGLARLPALLSKHKPQIVIIELGANDGLRGQSIKTMQDNLQLMIDASKAANAKVIIAGMQIPPNYGPRYTKQFREVFPLLAEKNNVSLVPFLLENVAGDIELFQNDRLHPTAEAQPIILKNVLPVLADALK